MIKFCDISVPGYTSKQWYIQKNTKEGRVYTDILTEYIDTHKDVTPDYMYYFDHQVQKPVDQIFSLVMKEPETIYKKIIDEYNGKEKREKENNQDITCFFKPKIVKIKT